MVLGNKGRITHQTSCVDLTSNTLSPREDFTHLKSRCVRVLVLMLSSSKRYMTMLILIKFLSFSQTQATKLSTMEVMVTFLRILVTNNVTPLNALWKKRIAEEISTFTMDMNWDTKP